MQYNNSMFSISYSDEKRIFNIHTDGIPYLSVDMLDRLGIPNLYTTRYISYDPEKGEGVRGLRLAVMKDETVEEASVDFVLVHTVKLAVSTIHLGRCRDGCQQHQEG